MSFEVLKEGQIYNQYTQLEGVIFQLIDEADIDLVDEYRQTPLHLAAQNGH